MTSPRRKPTTTERHLGWPHQKQRDRLLRNHRDGTPCPCLTDNTCGPACLCRPHGVGQPMYRKAERNPDRMPLEADHTLARSLGGTKADRLLLATCNRSRGDGTRTTPTDERPAWWSREWYPVTPGQPRLVVVLCGPPGSGKTTAAQASGLTVYDRDDPQWRSDKHFAGAVAALARDPHARAVVIRTGSTSSARAKAAALCGATHTYLMPQVPARELGRRIARRARDDAPATLAALATWQARHDRDDDVPTFPGWEHITTTEHAHA